MRKFIGLTGILFFCATACFAYESALDDVDTTDYTHTTQNLKYFTEKEYQKAIQDYKNHFHAPKKQRKKDIKTPTTPFSDAESNPEYKVLDEVLNHKGSIMIPAVCETDNGEVVDTGHYSLEYYVDKYNQEWLILSQGSMNKIKIAAKKSKSSEKEDTINYAYAIGKGDTVKLLYGNIDVAVEANLHVIN
ncbi:MAG: hypothetical protein K6C94_06945 [Candidatus Gastranaerophilales bacterium]|nr:hypothetical protein [Candidatus Gastranaerophilales bacterium]